MVSRKLPHCQLRGHWYAPGGKGGVDEKRMDWGHVWMAWGSDGLEVGVREGEQHHRRWLGLGVGGNGEND